MPGVEQEKGGIIKRGGRFFNALVEADVPKVTVIIRKAYGGGYAVMGSKQLAADLNFAWPTARIAVIGAEGAAQLLVKRFPDPTAPEVQKIRADFIEGYNLNLATPWIAAERGYIDAVIQPHETRLLLRKSLRLLRRQAEFRPGAAKARPDADLGVSGEPQLVCILRILGDYQIARSPGNSIRSRSAVTSGIDSAMHCAAIMRSNGSR